MKHILAILILVAALLLLMIRNVAPDPYVYDEADYMYAASLGFAANYTDSPTLPLSEFVRTGLERGRVTTEHQSLSEQIRASDDIVFYRHWHGPLYLDLLLPVSRLGLSERQTRTAMLAVPALTLVILYCGCLWLMRGRVGTFAALIAAALFLSSSAATDSTELAPHQLFALLSVVFLFLLLKFLDTKLRIYWFGSVIAAGLAFCTLEVAFVLIGTLAVCAYVGRRPLQIDLRLIGTSLGLFAGTVLIVWPAAIYKLSFVKAYLFMAYLGLFRKSPWGNEAIFDVWRHRVLDSPLEWFAVAFSLILFFRKSGGRPAYPALVSVLLMLATTARVVTSSTRYSLLFMPALDIFAALTLAPWLAASRGRTVFAAALVSCGLLGMDEYREFTRSHDQDPRPPAVLTAIREHRLENETLAVPQEELPMIHFYFPRMHLRGYDTPDASVRPALHRGYPVDIEPAH
ncbi:MAG TPA: hypothetical protein VKT81_15675 [Bryobacteraceae bacterium]|nr:hypothetical protein [Bryobacteraceae bacterium]